MLAPAVKCWQSPHAEHRDDHRAHPREKPRDNPAQHGIEHYREVVQRIRDSGVDVPVNLKRMPAEKSALAYLVSRLPEDSVWSAFGIGRHSLKIASESIRAGGHIRVGFEDNLYLERGILADSNSALVGQAVGLVSRLGHSVATADEARQILNLPGRDWRHQARQRQSAAV